MIRSHPTDAYFNNKGDRFFPGTLCTVSLTGWVSLSDYTLTMVKKDSLTVTKLQTFGTITTDVNGNSSSIYTLDCSASGQTVFIG